jgi:glucokinase
MRNRRPEARSRKSSLRPPDAGRAFALGIDIGATKVVSVLVGQDGRVVGHGGRQVHSNDGPAGVFDSIVASARSCLDTSPVEPQCVGVGVAAQVDPARGTVVYAPNLYWRDVPLGPKLTKELGLPVRLVNDARAATFAEWTFGAGRGETDLFCLVLGTGVGGSAVCGGRLVEGGTHSAGEVGHLTVVSGGRRCHCPNSGCFEAYVGGWAIAERAQEAVRANPAAGRRLLSDAGSLEIINATTVLRAHRSGDALAGQLISETERFLADGVVSVVNAFNPSALVLAGGLVAGRPEWVSVVETAVRTRCQPAAATVRVVAASLGEEAGAVGAAALALERSFEGS